VLNEFYEKTQVMIGEAISVSELKAMLHEHLTEIPPSLLNAVAKHTK
jgi:hypothetical protein